MARALWLLLAMAAGCGGDVYTVDVRPAAVLGCTQAPIGGLQSVGIEVVRETSDGLEPVADLAACQSFPQTRDVRAMLGAFEETGVIIAGVPAETRTILRFVGYQRDSCWQDSERVCGITCPPVRVDDIPAEGVTANFICRPVLQQSEAGRLYSACRNLELLTQEQQSSICSRVE